RNTSIPVVESTTPSRVPVSIVTRGGAARCALLPSATIAAAAMATRVAVGIIGGPLVSVWGKQTVTWARHYSPAPHQATRAADRPRPAGRAFSPAHDN